MNFARRYLKAIYAFVSAGSVPLLGAITESSDNGSAITQGEWITALVTGLVAGLGVAALPNRAPQGQPDNPAISEQDGRL